MHYIVITTFSHSFRSFVFSVDFIYGKWSKTFMESIRQTNKNRELSALVIVFYSRMIRSANQQSLYVTIRAIEKQEQLYARHSRLNLIAKQMRCKMCCCVTVFVFPSFFSRSLARTRLNFNVNVQSLPLFSFYFFRVFGSLLFPLHRAYAKARCSLRSFFLFFIQIYWSLFPLLRTMHIMTCTYTMYILHALARALKYTHAIYK